MSKRLQILLPDDEFKKLKKFCKVKRKSVAEIVRESIRNCMSTDTPEDPSAKISRLLRFAKFEGPTGDIEQILREIDEGRGD